MAEVVEEDVERPVDLADQRGRVGIAADPVEFHAWLTTSTGDLIAEPASTARFRVLLTVPRTNTDSGEEKT